MIRKLFLAAVLWACALPAFAGVPVLQDTTAVRGALTRAGAGVVPLTLLGAPLVVPPSLLAPTAWNMQVSGETPTSCVVAFVSGPAASTQWNYAATDCTSPFPTADGVTAGTWVFTVTPTGPSGAGVARNYTISTVGSTYTVGKPDDVANKTTGLKGIAAGTLSGKTVAFARWSEAAFKGNQQIAILPCTGVAPNIKCSAIDPAGSTTFSGFAPTPGRLTITSEDALNPTTISRLTITGGGRLDVTALNTHAHLAQYIPVPSDCSGTVNPTCANHNSSQSSNAYVQLGGSSALGYANDVTLTSMSIGATVGASESTQWLGGIKTVASGGNKIGNVHVNNVSIFQVDDGLKLPDTVDSLFENFTIDSADSDFIFVAGTGSSNIIFQDFVEVRPQYHVTKPLEHWDFFQISGPAVTATGNVTLRRGFMSVANGNIYETHGPFIANYRISGGFPTNNMVLQDILIENISAIGETYDAGTGWDVRFTTNVRGQAPNVTCTAPAVCYYTPLIDYSPGGDISGVFAYNFVQQLTPALVAQFATDGLPPYDTTNFVMFLHYGNPAWTTSDNSNSLRCTNYYSLVFQSPCAVIDYANSTPAQVATALRAAYAPILNGPMKITTGADAGKYYGSFFPDGTWNDGSVYGATATAISSFASPTSATTGEVITLNYQLNGAASGDIVITPHVAGVSGSFSSSTVTVASGTAQQSVAFTASTAGTATFTTTNGGSLTNATPVVVPISAAVDPPTSYTQSIAATAIALGNAGAITYTLNNPATTTVTITPGLSGVTGTFSPTTGIIPFGETTAIVAFFPTSLGTATLSAANDNALANPSNLTVLVLSSPVSRGRMMRGRP